MLNLNFKYPLDRLHNKLLKRTLDIIISIFVIFFILSWLIPIIGSIIKLESNGPIFFKQLRGGKDCHPFLCYKFRTMILHQESNSFNTQSNPNYITKVGAVLRKSNLDELPNFFNVLFGEMSIVGPRPHMLAHDTYFANKIPYYKLRYCFKPGITGWAQIHGFRGYIEPLAKMEERVAYHLYYIKHYSFWLDLKIMFLTLFTKKGYGNAV